MSESQNRGSSTRLGVAGWVTIVVLVIFLAWAGWYALHAWNALAGIDISPMGWFFIGFGGRGGRRTGADSHFGPGSSTG